MAQPSDFYVILDRSDPHRPLWCLCVRADRAGWQSAAGKPIGWIPADLDDIGQPVPDEQARLVLWVTTALMDRPIVLHPLPGGGHVYRVSPVEEVG